MVMSNKIKSSFTNLNILNNNSSNNNTETVIIIIRRNRNNTENESGYEQR